MKRAIYPGSFNPWHDGHEDVLEKALKIFDEVTIARGINPDKEDQVSEENFIDMLFEKYATPSYCPINVEDFSGMLVDQVKKEDYCAVIRGLRNGNDLQYEQNQQYWNEDLGLNIPVVYFITDRKYGHISSSAIRAIERIKK